MTAHGTGVVVDAGETVLYVHASPIVHRIVAVLHTFVFGVATIAFFDRLQGIQLVTGHLAVSIDTHSAAVVQNSLRRRY